MSQVTCSKCNRAIDSEEAIKTDKFQSYGSEVKGYCPSCFLQDVEKGFDNYEIDNCVVCNSPLVLQFDNEETLSLAREDYTVHFTCKKVKDAIERDDQAEIERLDKEDHDWLIVYTIQPNPEEPDFG
ncbi:hypothetical protein F9802_08870 [Bacillus aerolatus]|uniref:Uncharacterized protein n=1 Tax=Bacillus aerolatus TaxID=2653354 RepID=A0A6I1FG34_9BACI|nr:hypothetical protein [Bacillus aerolatus]KAB7707113.1 hypothetical protein F9802_08870 [Bacillus aerolatus]